jgi:hypothetical protein
VGPVHDFIQRPRCNCPCLSRFRHSDCHSLSSSATLASCVSAVSHLTWGTIKLRMAVSACPKPADARLPYSGVDSAGHLYNQSDNRSSQGKLGMSTHHRGGELGTNISSSAVGRITMQFFASLCAHVWLAIQSAVRDRLCPETQNGPCR